MRWSVIVVSLVLLAIGATTVITGIQLSSRQDRIIGCVTGYSNALADTLDTRAESTGQAQEALDEVMAAVSAAFDQANEQASLRVRATIKRYVALRETARETQARHPLPQPPRDVCSNLVD